MIGMPRWISNPQQVGAVNLMDRQRHLRLRVFGEQFQDGFVGGHVLQLEVLSQLPVGDPGMAVGARHQQHLEDVRVALLGSHVRRRLARLHGVVGAGALLQQPLCRLHL